jgi:hypothetical protein
LKGFEDWFAMLKAAVIVAFVLIGVLPASSQVVRIETCFEENIAALRLSELDQGIAHCDKIIDDVAAPSERRGKAFAQRGLMHARQWTIFGGTSYATRGIADITEALRLHAPTMERRHMLLVIRAEVYVATGQTRRAAEDYAAILRDDPNNADAKRGRDRLGPVEGL